MPARECSVPRATFHSAPVSNPSRMRHALAGVVFAAALHVVGGSSRADLIIVQQVKGGGQQGEMTIKIKDGKSRADLAQPVSMITDAATGETIVLQNNRKTFSRIPAAQTKTLVEQFLKAQGGGEPPKLEATGKKETVSGHETEIYLWNVGTIKMRFWIARDFPNATAIQAQLDSLQNSGLSALAASMMPKAADLPGVRLRTEFNLPGHKVTYTISSIKEQAVEAGTFDVPKDFTEVPVPLPGAPESP